MLTDHKPLTYALSSHPERHSTRQVRHLDFISQFTTDLKVQRTQLLMLIPALKLMPCILEPLQSWILKSWVWHKQMILNFPSCNWTPHFNSKVFPFCPKESRQSVTLLWVYSILTSHSISDEPFLMNSIPFHTLVFVLRNVL